MKLIFRNVTVVNASGKDLRDVFVDEGKIVGPFEDISARVIDGSGKFLMPGAIDGHVHFREPGASQKEDWET
ncbi:MAG: dihydroorotase, partial [Patescibacteria group bacterium]